MPVPLTQQMDKAIPDIAPIACIVQIAYADNDNLDDKITILFNERFGWPDINNVNCTYR